LGRRVADELGARCRFAHVDVSDTASAQAALGAAITAFGRLDGAINCAGIAHSERTIGKHGPHTLETFARVIQVNLVGAFNVIRLAANAMARNEPQVGSSGERGIIINTASVAAFDGQIGQAAYAASKGGVAALTLPMARDLARHGIRVMAIAPGIFDTAMVAGLPEPARQSLSQQMPFPARLGRPGECAALARHIVENEMLNGEVIRLDAAIRLEWNRR
jgi:NAD(P)-dependent dehydrogenase (short-subunit alcohol dehydrogenase family)